METNKLIKSRLRVMDETIKHIFEAVTELYCQKELICWLLFLKEEKEQINASKELSILIFVTIL